MSETDISLSTVPGARVLIVEDEEAISEAVTYSLRAQGFIPLSAPDADTALRLFREQTPDVLILDVMLPSGSGFDICRLVRQTGSTVPILMLTARVAEADRVQGLEIGADDYLVKPFSMRELVARIKALLRRQQFNAAPAPTSPEIAPNAIIATTIGIIVDPDKREVKKQGVEIAMSRKEFDLLALFLSHPGRVFDRQTLLDRVWGEDAFVDDRTVDVHIRWIREKIEQNPSKPVHLLTVRGVGYKFQG